MLHRVLILLAIVTIWAPQAPARERNLRVVFGPEFTFQAVFPDVPMDQAHTNREVRDLIVTRQHRHLVEGQPDGARFSRIPDLESHRADKFISPNGWDFTMSTDPGVVEVQMSPMSWEKFDQFKNDIQDAIFVSAANEGYFPGLFQGGGHINIGTAGLIADSTLLVRNFLADLINHSELFMGIFGYDTHNALPFPLYTKDAQGRILFQFERYDRREINLDTLIREIEIIQRNQHDPLEWVWNPDSTSPRYKRTAFSLECFGIDQKGRIELRAVRPQANMDIWIKQIRLLHKRLIYLQNQTEPIPLKISVPLVEPIVLSFEGHALNPPVDAQAALHAFHIYLAESGERWQDHRSYLWPKWLNDGDVEKYERSEAFRQAQAIKCASDLVAVGS